MADRDLRKAELERKKAKLAEMRKEKQRKEEAKKSDKTVVEVKKSDLDQKRDETSMLLQNLGLPEAVPAEVPQNPPSPKSSTDTTTSESTDKPGKMRQPPKLTTTQVALHTIQPKELIVYAKETQTLVIEDDEEPDEEEALAEGQNKENYAPAESTTTAQIPEKREPKEKLPKRIYTDSEADRASNQPEFLAFFDRTTRIVERLLHDPNADSKYIFADYTGEVAEQTIQQQTDAVRESRVFYDEHWSRNRLCSSLDWSPQFSELLASSYLKNPASEVDPHGIALIWNSKLSKTAPEYVFHCQSPVTKVKFAKYHPNLLIGGTYSGQIVIWDNRTFKRTPVQRTKLGASAHTHPVYCIDVVGSQNAHNVISVSTDGKLCSWSLDMFSKPQECLELQAKANQKSVSVTALAFPGDSVNNFVVGSEDGIIYSGQRHANKKPGISDAYEKHGAMVTGLDCHRAQSKMDFSHLFLSSSFDWTVKLWSTKNDTPLHSFENFGAYVLDVGWSPIHPGLFAATDLTGRLSFWNMNVDTEVPIASSMVNNGSEGLNSLAWHQSGTMLATGSQNGRISLFELGETLAQPAVDESSRLNQTLTEIYARLEEQPAAKSNLTRKYDL
ncbi:unnamed protein product [Oikopleura dioica]|uniref:Uncharacterized protein n=1 Tax=Oikopleura dioica TaxID=34765 RepID=E4WYM9_OIKDI|nr:unnamed protein product [Oikopleura dioica]